MTTSEQINSREFPRAKRLEQKLCPKGMLPLNCPYNPRLGCDCGLNPKDEDEPASDDDITDPPLTREELENARDYARRINTELRTYDAHNKPTNP